MMAGPCHPNIQYDNLWENPVSYYPATTANKYAIHLHHLHYIFSDRTIAAISHRAQHQLSHANIFLPHYYYSPNHSDDVVILNSTTILHFHMHWLLVSPLFLLPGIPAYPLC